MKNVPPFIWYLMGVLFGSGNAALQLAQDTPLKIAGVIMFSMSVFVTMVLLFLEAKGRSKEGSITRWFGMYCHGSRNHPDTFAGIPFPLTIVSPCCGLVTVWASPANVPWTNLPCPCGKKGHFIYADQSFDRDG